MQPEAQCGPEGSQTNSSHLIDTIIRKQSVKGIAIWRTNFLQSPFELDLYSSQALKKVLDSFSDKDLVGESFNLSERSAKLRRGAVEICQRLDYVLEFKADTDGAKVIYDKFFGNLIRPYHFHIYVSMC